jgi:hypothetical protein
MSHLVDRNAVEVVELGPCECPGKPHESDTIRIRKHISYPDMLHIGDAAGMGSVEAVWAVFNIRVAGWNLVKEKGKPLPLSRDVWQNLSEGLAEKVNKAIGDVTEGDETELPND